ncbi:MAG: undecaprenyl/decaprenyl-phosphate alpha-N-acetylglucosaminyl 1-phosphate transferase [Bacteroidales bacterium]|nr:undecaprenyl/decaprenyl-phosphate alpha-N-acetylglucosaminyl 1-phosphate transferase [Bacteroidales bacterium]
MNLSILYLIVFCLITIGISLFVNWFLLRYSGNKFAKDAPMGSQRWEVKKKPTIGGISFMVGFVGSILFYLVFWKYSPVSMQERLTISILICAITTAFIIGLYDDLHNAKVPVKFAVQIIIAIALIFGNIYIHLTNVLVIDYLITLLWVVGIINSLNMLDNMDGVTAMVSIGILGSILLLRYDTIADLNKLIMIGFICSIIGFLRYNLHPSKMYMGDVGSMTLGCTLAIFGILYLWNNPAEPVTLNVSLQHILCIALVFVVPLTDTITVFVKRIAKHRSPFQGDKGHTTHHLVYAGWSQKWVAPFYLLLTLSAGLIVYCILTYHTLTTYIIGVIYVLAVFGFLFGISLKNTDKE